MEVAPQFDGPGHIGVNTSKGPFMYNGRFAWDAYERGAGGRVVDPDAALANVAVSARLTNIAATFLKDPYRWGELWKLNAEEIKNPQRIYPGQVIALDKSGNQPQLKLETIVEPRLRFVAILAAARECDAPYVWAAQVAQARKHHIREDLIDHIRARGDPAKLSAEERDVMKRPPRRPDCSGS